MFDSAWYQGKGEGVQDLEIHYLKVESPGLLTYGMQGHERETEVKDVPKGFG